ncbi:hypothetical protein C8R42DRAFT_649876, partial [Lentinula raphanica]
MHIAWCSGAANEGKCFRSVFCRFPHVFHTPYPSLECEHMRVSAAGFTCTAMEILDHH